MVSFLSILPMFLLMFGLSSYFMGILCVLNCGSPGQHLGWPFSKFIFWFRVSWTWWWCKNSHKRLFLLNKSGEETDVSFSGLLTFFFFPVFPESMVLWVPATCQCLSFESLTHAVQILDSWSWKTLKPRPYFVLRVAKILVVTYQLYFHLTFHFWSFILFKY